ncbi:unnamed protein product [Nezara viridula]|uniref:Uncharacterized protein n=1 Tax=Nezara viridula TaxID=85310 RepID=A0A9P0H9L2_NEZVI|nr:unnamed protein product [Nezara viridula]
MEHWLSRTKTKMTSIVYLRMKDGVIISPGQVAVFGAARKQTLF